MKIVEMNRDDDEEQALRVTWRYKKRFEKTDQHSNLVVAIFTTAYGRCELYRYMCAVDEQMDGPTGSMLLYNDTDSVIYEYIHNPALPNDGNPLVDGQLLGEMSDEYKGHEIEEFFSGGNKQYGLKVRSHKTGIVDYKLKIRGITLNNKAGEELLSYDKFKSLVQDQPLPKWVDLPTDNITRDNLSNVYTTHSVKRYMPTFRKGNVDMSDPNYTIYPPGYVFDSFTD